MLYEVITDMKEGEVAEVFAPLKAGLSALVRRFNNVGIVWKMRKTSTYPCITVRRVRLV